MMNKNLFSDGLGNIDVDAVERLLLIEQQLERQKARRKRAWIAPVLVAATLSLLLCTLLIAIPFIPKDLGIEYQTAPADDANLIYTKDNVWIYYETENGQSGRKYVKLPLAEQNVFLAWKHLSGVGDEVELVDYAVTTDPTVNIQPVPQTIWEALSKAFTQGTETKTVTATLSAQITSYPNYEELIESLQKTLAEYAGVELDQVKLLIEGDEPIIIPGISLEFRHSLQGMDPVMVPCGQMLEITVSMTNISSENIEFTGSWMAFVPSAILTMGDMAIITHESYPMTEEYQKYVLAPGQSREITYTFPIPENAVCGAYDLYVTFGEQSFTFEDAVNVVALGLIPSPIVTADEFAEFLQKYGFDQTNPTVFKANVGNLSYQGSGIFESMSYAEVDWLPGYSGEQFYSEFFSCGTTTFSEDSFILTRENVFEAIVLPDGMSLPYGIDEQDSLLQALNKLGLEDEFAKSLIENIRTSKGDQAVLSGLGTEKQLYLEYTGTTIKIVYSQFGTEDGKDPDINYTLALYYSATDQRFLEFTAATTDTSVNRPNFRSVTLRQEPGSQYTFRFASTHDYYLLGIMNDHEWKKGSVEAEALLTFDCGGIPIFFADGKLFTAGGYYLDLAGYDLYYVDALYTAVAATKDATYDYVIYYADKYYGYNPSLDQKFAGRPGYSDNMATDVIGGNGSASVVGYQGTELTGLAYGMPFTLHEDYLVTKDGKYFEQFTYLDPSFDDTSITILQSPGCEDSITLSVTDSLTLRTILNLYEWESSWWMDDYEFDYLFEINGYKVSYSPQFGTLRIGNYWGAGLSEADRTEVNKLLSIQITME